MREIISVTGMVIRASAFGESDKRLVLLTRERGKITVFSRGCKRPGNVLMAASCPFVFGTFFLVEGRDAYNLQRAEVKNYFETIAADMEAACYGSYFLEMADYYSRENMDGTELLKLLYQSLRALLKPALPNRLVRRIFELKAMVQSGEYSIHPGRRVSESANYAWEYVLYSSIEKLYQFTLTEEVFGEFSACVEDEVKKNVDKHFRSLDILETIL